MDNNDNALRDADDNIQSSHELGYFISYQVLHGQLKVAQKKIKKLEQENKEIPVLNFLYNMEFLIKYPKFFAYIFPFQNNVLF